MKKLFIIFATAAFVFGCSDKKNNDNQNQTTETPPTTQQPEEYPHATGDWTKARTFIDRSNPNNDPNFCETTDFTVQSESGVYLLANCNQTKAGQLTADEFKKLNDLTVAAYSHTKAMICPALMKLDVYYDYINSSNVDHARKFDPDGMCYSGGEEQVKNYRAYLQKLLDKYQATTRR